VAPQNNDPHSDRVMPTFASLTANKRHVPQHPYTTQQVCYAPADGGDPFDTD